MSETNNGALDLEEDATGKDLEKEMEISDPGDLTTQELWDNVGFHRSVAGFFYNLPLALFQLIMGIFIGGFIMGLLYPFPESQGYRGTATGIFGLLFQAFDLGTANIMARFIGETNINNPKKMVQYIQYFIWYQMITGLIQVTIVSAYALFFVPRTQLAYAVWIMLVFCTTQYPGCLHIFHATLGTLQQYDKVTIINFFTGELFYRFSEIGFVLLGKWLGARNPAVGEILGIAIGGTIGGYFTAILSTFIAAHYFKKVMKKYGVTVKDCFRHEFDRKLVKECTIWGLKSGLPFLLYGGASFIHLMIFLNNIPQYTTWVSLAGFSGGWAGLIGWRLDLGGSISESYLNGKKKLAQYIFGQAIRFTAQIMFWMLVMVFVVMLLFEPVLILIGLDYYILSNIFIVPTVIVAVRGVFDYFAHHTIICTKHINFNVILMIFESILSVFVLVLLIIWLKLPQTYGQPAIAWILPGWILISGGTKTIISYVYVHYKIMKIKVPLYQSFVATGLSSLLALFLTFLFYQYIFIPLNEMYGTLIALIPMLVYQFIAMLIVYFPAIVILGGFDDGAEEIMRKTEKMSGVGRIIVTPMYRIMKWAARHTRLHNRFAFDDTEALQEARELMVIKNKILKEKVKIV
ncbi:MAG: hypothetical protein ACFFCS_04155 [Candidatus Hodarchaeota archaeon]